MNEVRQATPEEEAVMNMALFQTEEMFNERVKAALVKMLAYDTQIHQQVEAIAQRRLMAFKENLARSMAGAVRTSY
jgi:hypothetical protein